MGENLYEDPYVFIRELLHNVIDTTRHRVYFERSKGRSDYKPKGITVSSWRDEENYQWVRIDDHGMGMDENIIIKYFLKIGELYYQSAQFRADVLSYAKQDQPRFVPISRFGIGALSCFILGDKVEISTRHVGEGKSEPYSIRLGLSGLHSFYVLQSEADQHYVAKEMPGRTVEERASYRIGENHGTSVAVRIDPQKEKTRLDLQELLSKYVLTPPVPIVYEGEMLVGSADELLTRPWADGIVEEELTDREMAQIESVLGFKFEKKVKLRLVPLDLTKHSPTPNLKGQALLGHLWVSKADIQKIRNLRDSAYGEDRVEAALRVSFDSDKKKLTVSAEYHDRRMERRLQDQVAELRERHRRSPALEPDEEFTSRETIDNIERRLREAQREVQIDVERALSNLAAHVVDLPEYSLNAGLRWLSHNGIAVPTRVRSRGLGDDYLRLVGNRYTSGYWMRQVIALGDALRPDVSLSRDQLKGLSSYIYSAVTLAFRKALKACEGDDLPLDGTEVFVEILGKEEFLFGNLSQDPLMELDGEWARESVIDTNRGFQSLQQIRDGLAGGETFEIRNLPSVSYFFHRGYSFKITQVFAATLVQMALKVRLKLDGSRQDIFFQWTRRMIRS